MRKTLLSAAAMALALMGAAHDARAQLHTPAIEGEGAQSLSRAQRDAVVAAVKDAYRKRYVFPDKVPAILARLDKARASGRYDVGAPGELASLISADLREASQDGHAYLEYTPERYAAAVAPAGADEGLAGFDAAAARRGHHGLSALSILPGNVRYLKIDSFAWVSDETGQAYDDAMRFLKEGDAAIIDLRGNGGGASEAVQYLVSHFLKAGTLEITFLEAGKDPVQTRVLDNLPAGRMIGKPLYVLIDQGTASAAESFAYDVQQFKLGRLVGAGTAGGANNNDFTPIAPSFMLSVSVGRPVHPVSKTNWEGVGVAPDVAAKSSEALETAHALALRELAAKPASATLKAEYDWALPAAQARVQPPTAPAGLVRAAPGSYGKYVVTADKDGLLVARPGHPLWPEPRRLQPLNGEGLFLVEGIEMLRIGLKPDAIDLWWRGDDAPRVLRRN